MIHFTTISRTLSLTLLLFSSQQTIFAQAKIDSLELVQLQTQLQSNIKINNKAIQLPTQTKYNLELIGSDNRSIINLDGKINQPLVPKTVNLLYKLTRKSDKATAEIPIKNLKIQGKYTNTGINPKPFVIPSLREWHGEKGVFNITSSSKIIIEQNTSENLEVAKLLQEDLQKQFGYKLEITSTKKASKGDIFISKKKDTTLGNEGYAMEIGDYLQFSAPTYTGNVFATRTILQLLDQSSNKNSIPKGEIRDYPTYSERGLILDVGRKFFTIDFLNDYVEILSYYKISNFQIHLNDNAFHKYFNFDWDKTPSGFRLENDTYPGLASADGHYTKQEFKDLQKKAFRYGIKIIPEIDVPAHSLAIAKVVPEIGSDKYGKDHLDLANPKTYEVVQAIFDEYTKGKDPVFIGKEVHIGTDEYDKKEAESFRKFTDFLIKAVQKNGKDVRAWGALTHAQGKTPVTSKNVVLNMWYNGYADPIEMKKLGYKQISTPDGWLYIVPAAGYYYDYLNVNNIYNNWEPRNIGDVTFEKGDPTVVGGMFGIWNDIAGNGISEKDVHNRAFPAIQVLAEKMWTASDHNLALFDFNQKKVNVAEAPGLNLRGYFGEETRQILHLPFENSVEDLAGFFNEKVNANNPSFTKGIINNSLNGTTTLHLPLEEIGNSYTVSFWLKSDTANATILFKSKNATFELNKNSVEYNRDGYSYQMTDNLNLNDWSFITITGNKENTTLYVNGKLVKKMETEKIILPYKEKNGKDISFNKVKTLTFPLRQISLKNVSLDDLKVYNKEFSKDEVLSEYTSVEQ